MAVVMFHLVLFSPKCRSDLSCFTYLGQFMKHLALISFFFFFSCNFVRPKCFNVAAKLVNWFSQQTLYKV